MTRESDRQMGMYGQAPTEIRAVRSRFENGASALVVRDAEVFIRRLSVGQVLPEEMPASLQTPEASAFLTESRPEFGGRSILAALRHTVGEELRRGSFISPEKVPDPTVQPQLLIALEAEETTGKIHQNGVITPPAQREWVALHHFRRFGLNSEIARKVLEGLATKPGQSGGKDILLFNRGEAEARIREYLEQMPRPNQDGVFKDKEGQEWAQLGFLSRKLEVGAFALADRLKGLRQIPGFGRNNQPVILYSVEDATTAAPSAARIKLKEKWVVIAHFRKYGLSDKATEVLLSGLKPRQRDSSKPKPIYLLSEAEKVIQEAIAAAPELEKGRIFIEGKGLLVTAELIISKYGLRRYSQKLRLAQMTPAGIGKDESGRSVSLYSYNDAVLEFSKKTPQKKSDNTWVARGHFKSIGIPKEALTRILSKVAQRSRKKGDRTLVTYDRKAAEEKIAAYLARTPSIDLETGIYQDSKGKNWVPRSYFYREYEIGYQHLNTRLSTVPARPGISDGKVVTLYSLSEGLTALKDLIETPSAGAQSGAFVEKEVIWRSVVAIARELGLSASTVTAAVEGTEFRFTKARNGKISKFYDLDKARRLLEPLTSLPTADTRMVTGPFLASLYPISDVTIAKKLKQIGVRGRGVGGRHAILYPLHEAEKILGAPSK